MTFPATNLHLGAHWFLWASDVSGDDIDVVAAGAAAAGLEFVEVPLLDPTFIDTARVRETLARHGITATCSLGLPSHAHAPDEPTLAIEFLHGAIDTAAALGSHWLTGSLYGHLGRVTGRAPTDGELETIARVLREAADHAAEVELRLGVEIINRYETHLVNTAAAAANLLAAIDRPGRVFAHLDTFHMNIEEGDVGAAVRHLGEQLGYVHLAESTRDVLGSGMFPFDELLDALDAIGFDGPAVIEAFLHGPDDLLTTTASWRRPRVGAGEFVERSLAALATAARHETP